LDWSAEAIATLLTGITAVGGAVYVGVKQARIQSRQASISDRQTKILDRQIALAELALRKDLFDERFAVYEATQKLLMQAMREGGWVAWNDPVLTPFFIAKDKAKFLFRPAVSEGLQEIWEKVNAGTAIHKVMTSTYEREGHYGENNPDRQHAITVWLDDRLRNLSDLFGSELRLSDHDMQLG
jgi:hypothetical protein